jgi:hypothetical protein
MLWDDLRTLIMLRLTTQSPCMCTGCQRGRRSIAAADCDLSRPTRLAIRSSYEATRETAMAAFAKSWRRE